MSRQSSRHFLVSIPRVLLQRREGSNKKYFAYEIQITPVSGNESDKWSLLRRYSEFHRFDKYLQKSNPMIKNLDFPPKKSFGNMVSEYFENSNICNYCTLYSVHTGRKTCNIIN